MVASEEDTRKAIDSFRPDRLVVRIAFILVILGNWLAMSWRSSVMVSSHSIQIIVILKAVVSGFVLSNFYGATLCTFTALNI